MFHFTFTKKKLLRVCGRSCRDLLLYRIEVKLAPAIDFIHVLLAVRVLYLLKHLGSIRAVAPLVVRPPTHRVELKAHLPCEAVCNCERASPTLKLPGFCAGGYSLKVAKNFATMA